VLVSLLINMFLKRTDMKRKVISVIDHTNLHGLTD
jgi:hypothetical protein